MTELPVEIEGELKNDKQIIEELKAIGIQFILAACKIDEVYIFVTYAPIKNDDFDTEIYELWQGGYRWGYCNYQMRKRTND